MSASRVEIALSEWETVDPETAPSLAGRGLIDSNAVRRLADDLGKSRRLKIVELRRGLQITAFSYVGRVDVGDVTVTVHPKIKGEPFLELLRYAYGFRALKLFATSTQQADHCGLEDLLVSQLAAEVQELAARGLARSYLPKRELLSTIRGRIEMTRLASSRGTPTAALPCAHHLRSEDSPLNRVLLAGLKLAGHIASSVELRRRCRRLAALLNETISSAPLDGAALATAERAMNRLTRAYAPALALIRLLLEAQGIALQGRKVATPLPGFLFDMNAFFQSVVSRFLHDHLTDYDVYDEFRLQRMMRYDPQYNPRGRRSPAPRPDFAVHQHGKLHALLDAKYRDLWEHPLPRSMLYQLVVYARSDPKLGCSTILYAARDPLAREARINVADAIYGKPLGQVRLRPVHLPTMAKLLADRTAAGRRTRETYAHQLAFTGFGPASAASTSGSPPRPH